MPSRLAKTNPLALDSIPLPEHGSRPVCERDNPAGILALAFPHSQEAESSAIDRRKRNVRPFQMQRLTDAQPGFQHQDGNIVQRLRASRKVDFLLLPGENEIPDPLPGEQPDTRDALNLSPLMGKPQHPAKGSKLPVDRCRAYSGAAGHYIAFYDPFVYPVKPCPGNGRVFEQPIELRRVELDCLRLVLMAGFHMGNEPLCQVCKHRRGLAALRFPLRPLPARYGVPLRSGGPCAGSPVSCCVECAPR